ncbi:MAG: hypothetical protein JXA43_03685 [Candidatus Diapherotrites archaeon]|nr:hypothetical protein [Candidatus Diapherotrites archaeon]
MKNHTYVLHFIMLWVIVYIMYTASTGTTALIIQPLFTTAFAAIIAGAAVLFEMRKNKDLKFMAK